MLKNRWSIFMNFPTRASEGKALLLLGVATASAFAQPNDALIRRGESILSGECAMCHSRSGSTQGGAPSFSAIARRSDFAELKTSLESGITSGHPAMPRVSLSGSEIAAVLAYLATLRQP
jgi:mono/diheme cytochrome c family protein